MTKLILALTCLLILTACDAATQATAVGVANGTQAPPAAGTVVDPAVVLHGKLLGSWKRVGQLCGTTYTTGLGEQHVAFTDTTMTVSLHFNCDNALHPAQLYSVSYDSAAVHASMTSSFTGNCPITYAATPNSGTDTLAVQVFDTDSPAALQLATGSTCSGARPQVDVYHKE